MGALYLLPRLVYFAVAPFFLVVAAMVLPMAGVLINIVLMLFGMVMVEALQGLSERHWLARVILRRQLAFAAYYRAHPPRSFAYYVFFPLLFPYWLINKTAREEVALYRGFTRFGVALILGHSILDYLTTWAPEIPFDTFLGASLGMFIIQLAFLLAFVIPLASTLATFHVRGEKRRVRLLLVVAGLSFAVTMLGVLNMRRPMVPAEVGMRVEARTAVAPERAAVAGRAAVDALWAEIEAGAADIDSDGFVGGPALVRVHGALEGFYRADEANGFTAHAWPAEAPEHAIVQMHQPRGKPPVWWGRERDGTPIVDITAVPAEAFNVRPTRPRPHR